MTATHTLTIHPRQSTFGLLKMVEDLILRERIGGEVTGDESIGENGRVAPIFVARAIGYAACVGYGGDRDRLVQEAAKLGIKVEVKP